MTFGWLAARVPGMFPLRTSHYLTEYLTNNYLN